MGIRVPRAVGGLAALVAGTLAGVVAPMPAAAAPLPCPGGVGDVAALVAAINNANLARGAHTIDLAHCA